MATIYQFPFQPRIRAKQMRQEAAKLRKRAKGGLFPKMGDGFTNKARMNWATRNGTSMSPKPQK